jgi:hypothetical protein
MGNCLQDEGSQRTVSIARRQNGGELADLNLSYLMLRNPGGFEELGSRGRGGVSGVAPT